MITASISNIIVICYYISCKAGTEGPRGRRFGEFSKA